MNDDFSLNLVCRNGMPRWDYQLKYLQGVGLNQCDKLGHFQLWSEQLNSNDFARSPY